MDNKENKASYVMGQIFAIVLVGCVATCFASALIALTVKLVTFLL